MNTFTLVVLVVTVLIECAVVVWFVLKSAEADEAYEREIKRIWKYK